MFITGWTHDRGACTRLRIWQPLTKIRRLGLADTRTLEHSDTDTNEVLANTNIAVVGRGAGDRYRDTIKNLKGMGIKVVWDVDDNFMEIHPLSPHYAALGIMPVNMEREDGSGVPLWEDGRGGFNVKKNRGIRKSFPETIREADCVTVTNDVLKKVYGRFNDNVFVVPNSIDFNVWGGPDVKPADGSKVRVLYTGAANHQEDFLFVRDPLADLQKKYENVVLVFVGTDWKHLRNKLDYSRVEVHEWVDFVAYPHLIRSLACDIGIAPISEIMFNDCRSELKWMEYSALKMATVATDYGPYKRAVKDGETGLLVMEQKEWFDALSKLIEDAGLRKRLGINAYRDVWKNYNLDFVVEKWMEVFHTITQKEM